MNNKTNTNTMRTLRGSFRCFSLCAMALALVIVVNWGVATLPSAIVKPDISSEGLLNICDETKATVSSVSEPLTIYHIAQSGMIDLTLKELLERYADLNSNVDVVAIDPSVQPDFVSQYTTDSLSSNSLIVVSSRRFKVIDYTQIYVTSYENLTEEDYYNYYYYGIMPQGTPYFQGEAELTAAIDYVSSKRIPTVYFINNHGEDTLNTTISSYLTSDDIVTSTLTIVGGDGIPDDCTAVVLNNPKEDLSIFEAQTLANYLKTGGSVLLITDYRYYSQDKMPNLTSVIELMGMTSVDGLLVEGDSTRYNTYPTYLVPSVGTEGPGAGLSEAMQTLIPNAHGILSLDESDAQVRMLLSSSDNSYIKIAGENATVFDKEDGDIDGPFYIAASSTLGGTGKFAWFASPSIVNDQMDYYAGGANSAVFMSAVEWMSQKAVSVSVSPKSIQIQPLSMTPASASFWSIVITVCVPAALLGGGFIVWLRRRRK